MNILVPRMLYYGPVVRQVLSWADVRRPPAPCGSGCHKKPPPSVWETLFFNLHKIIYFP